MPSRVEAFSKQGPRQSSTRMVATSKINLCLNRPDFDFILHSAIFQPNTEKRRAHANTNKIT